MKFLPAILMMIGGVLLTFGSDKVTPVNPDIVKPTVTLGSALEDYKSLMLELNAKGVEKLRAGTFNSEADYAAWFGSVNVEALTTVMQPLLDQGSKAFGGPNWTAEKHAAFIEQYNR
jgi:hypothetical protein